MHTNRLLCNLEKALPLDAVAFSGKIARLYAPVAMTWGETAETVRVRDGDLVINIVTFGIDQTFGRRRHFTAGNDCGTAEEKDKVKTDPPEKNDRKRHADV